MKKHLYYKHNKSAHDTSKKIIITYKTLDTNIQATRDHGENWRLNNFSLFIVKVQTSMISCIKNLSVFCQQKRRI